MGNKFLNTTIDIRIVLAIISGIIFTFSILSSAKESPNQTNRKQRRNKLLRYKIIKSNKLFE